LEENYRPDIRTRPHLPHGRVFTVRRRGKKPRPRGLWGASARTHSRPRGREKKKNIFFYFLFFILNFFFGSSCRLGKREFFFNFQFSVFGFRFSIPKIPKLPELRGLRGRSREKKKVFSA
jgi:hypothetical protein